MNPVISKKFKSIQQLAEKKKLLASRKKELEISIRKDFNAMKNEFTIQHLAEVALSTMKQPDETNVYARSIGRLIGMYAAKSSRKMLSGLEKWIASFKRK